MCVVYCRRISLVRSFVLQVTRRRYVVLAFWLLDRPRSVAHDRCLHCDVRADVRRAACSLRRMLRTREQRDGTSLGSAPTSVFGVIS